MSQKHKGFPLWILAIPVAGIALYLISRAVAGKQYVLTITHSGSGTLDISDGTHSYSGPSQVTITATPDSGFQANWNLNGIDVAQGLNEYSLYINGVNSLIVSFVPIGGPPTPPTGIKPVGTIGTLQNFRFWFPFATGGIDVRECDENWNDGAVSAKLMQFQVFDAGGKGVPNIEVAVYPDINPDTSPYKTVILFGGYPLPPGGQPAAFLPYDPSNPLILFTDNFGTIKFYVKHSYGADDITAEGGGIELSRGTQVYAEKFCILAGSVRVVPIYKGLAAGVGCYWTGGGGGATVSMNRIIRAEIVDTDKYTLQSLTYSYGVRWKA